MFTNSLNLPPIVTRRLISTLSATSLMDNNLIERTEPLYRRLIESSYFLPTAPNDNERKDGGGGGDEDEEEDMSGPPPIVNYIEQLPYLARERLNNQPPSNLCFVQLANLLTLLWVRFGEKEEVSYLKLRALVPSLRAAARAVNLSHAEEEVMEALFKLLSTPPKEPPKPPPPVLSFAEMAAKAPPPPPQQAAVDVTDAEEEKPLQLSWGAKPAGSNKWADSDEEGDGELDLSSLKAVTPVAVDVKKEVTAKEAASAASAAGPSSRVAVLEAEDYVAPPDDWRSLPVFPTHSDLSGDPLQLPRNVTNGRYESADEYLMSSFLLLREDSLAPLRRGISSYRKREALDERSMHLYGHVELQSLRCAARGVVYRVTFSPMGEVDWQRTQRLVYGSLLALSCDHFDTILWAVVAARDASILGGPSPQIDIAFPEGEHFRFQEAQARGLPFIMAESASYFEAHRHVLQALQRTDAQSIPFGKTLLNCAPIVDPPSYLLPPDGAHMDARGDADRYDFSGIVPQIHSTDSNGSHYVRVLNSRAWPKWQPPKEERASNDTTSTTSYHLDEPQLDALRHALTKEVALISGVPATGKTTLTQLAISLLLKMQS